MTDRGEMTDSDFVRLLIKIIDLAYNWERVFAVAIKLIYSSIKIHKKGPYANNLQV